MADGIHHLHKRKRVHQLNQPYPHTDKWMRMLDTIVFFVALMSVVMTVPQALEIWASRSAANVSLISWVTYSFGAIFWMIYGIIHKEKALIAIYSLYAIINLTIVAGILLYG